MSYQVVVAAGAAKNLRRLPLQVQKTVLNALDELAELPRSGKPLAGELTGLWSLRRGDYRVVYRANDDEERIEVARIAHRRDVYRR